MIASFFASAAIQWWLRRFWEIGGLVTGSLGGLLGLYALMPEDHQQTLVAILQGNWGELSLKAAGGFIVWAFVQWRSYRATTKPQMVVDGKQIEFKEIESPAKAVMVEEVARTVIAKTKGKTLMEMLADKIGRR